MFCLKRKIERGGVRKKKKDGGKRMGDLFV